MTTPTTTPTPTPGTITPHLQTTGTTTQQTTTPERSAYPRNNHPRVISQPNACPAPTAPRTIPVPGTTTLTGIRQCVPPERLALPPSKPASPTRPQNDPCPWNNHPDQDPPMCAPRNDQPYPQGHPDAMAIPPSIREARALYIIFYMY